MKCIVLSLCFLALLLKDIQQSADISSIRRLADPAKIHGVGEAIAVVSEMHGGMLAFLSWIHRTYPRRGHIMNIDEPAQFAMPVIT